MNVSGIRKLMETPARGERYVLVRLWPVRVATDRGVRKRHLLDRLAKHYTARRVGGLWLFLRKPGVRRGRL